MQVVSNIMMKQFQKLKNLVMMIYLKLMMLKNLKSLISIDVVQGVDLQKYQELYNNLENLGMEEYLKFLYFLTSQK